MWLVPELAMVRRMVRGWDAGVAGVEVAGGFLVGIAATAGAAGDDGYGLAGVVVEESGVGGGLTRGDDAELGAGAGHAGDACSRGDRRG